MPDRPLTHYDDFHKTLDEYKVSAHASVALKDLRLVLLLAPTSAGKNTIIRHLLNSGKYNYVISDTTRPPRVNDGKLEQNGVEYWFRTEQDFLADLQAGEFLEAEIIHGQQVSGISIRELEKAKKAGKVAITDVDIEGVHNIIRAKSDTIAVMLLPPSFQEWQRRLARRGKMSEQERQRRFESALNIFQDGLKQSYYKFVISENIGQSAEIIDSLIKNGPNPHQGRGRTLLHQLIDGLKNT